LGNTFRDSGAERLLFRQRRYLLRGRAGGLGGCRSTTTELGCETMVMNQIVLTTSDQNVFQ
jgi:hypothetical protein